MLAWVVVWLRGGVVLFGVVALGVVVGVDFSWLSVEDCATAAAGILGATLEQHKDSSKSVRGDLEASCWSGANWYAGCDQSGVTQERPGGYGDGKLENLGRL